MTGSAGTRSLTFQKLVLLSVIAGIRAKRRRRSKSSGPPPSGRLKLELKPQAFPYARPAFLMRWRKAAMSARAMLFQARNVMEPSASFQPVEMPAEYSQQISL